MHGSKGLEADNVFILSANKGIFPHPKSTLKYEKNLFFVAITRAKLNLFIYSNKEKQIGGFQIPCKTIEL
jgi:DNA helicase-2/ATP-dependent DNA helicase PcrA